MRRTIRKQLGGRLGVLRFLNQLYDLRECRFSTDLGRFVLEGATFVDGRADHRIAGLLVDRHRFTGEHRLVNGRLALGDASIDRDLVTGTDHDRVAGDDFGGRNLDLLAITHDVGRGGRQIHEGSDGFRGSGASPHLEPMSEQDENQQECRCFIELLATKNEGRADAEQIPRPDTQDDEHRHIGNAVAKRAVRGNNERPDGIEDGAAGQHEQHEI